MTTWKDIIAKPGWSDLDQETQLEVRRQWIQTTVAPALADDPDRDAVLAEIQSQPIDTGQSYAASLVNAAGRGIATSFTAPISGAGGLGQALGIPGSESLRDYGDELTDSVNRAMPVNPANEGWGTTLAGGFGQGTALLATGGTLGLAGKGLGLTAKAASNVASRAMMATGVMSGAGEGAEMADRQELDGIDRLIATAGVGAFEWATEKLPFGMLAETGAVKRMLGDGAAPVASFTGSVLSNAAEEATATAGQNTLERLLAAPGATVPGYLDNTIEAAIGGIGGGIVFGAVNSMGEESTATPAIPTAPGSTTAPTATADPAGTAPPAPSPAPPYQPVTLTENGLPYTRDERGVWRTPALPEHYDAGRMEEDGMVTLNPTDPVEGNLIARLRNRSTQTNTTTNDPANPSLTQQAGLLQPDETAAPQETGLPPPPVEPGGVGGNEAQAPNPIPVSSPTVEPPLTFAATTLPATNAVPGPQQAPSGQAPSQSVATSAYTKGQEVMHGGKLRVIADVMEHPANGKPVISFVDDPQTYVWPESPPPAEAAPMVDNQTVTPPPAARSRPAIGFDLPSAEGVTDTIDLIQGEGLRLSEPNDSAEWEWYRQLQQDAASETITQRDALARARSGDVSTAKAKLAWVDVNLLGGNTSPDRAAAALTDYNVTTTAAELGPRLMADMEARLKGREQADDPSAAQEADYLKREREAKLKLITASATAATAPEYSGYDLANRLGPDDSLTIGGRAYTAQDIDATNGTLTLVDEDGMGIPVDAEDSFRVQRINDDIQEVSNDTTVEDDNDPFSLAPAEPEALYDNKIIHPNDESSKLAGTTLIQSKGDTEAAIATLKARRFDADPLHVETAINKLQSGRVSIGVADGPGYQSKAKTGQQYRSELQRLINALADSMPQVTGYEPAMRYAASMLKHLSVRAKMGYLQYGEKIDAPIYRQGYATHKTQYDAAVRAANNLLESFIGNRLSDARYSLDNGNANTLQNQQWRVDTTPQQERVAPGNPQVSSDQQSRKAAVTAALTQATGLKQLPARVEVTHTTEPATLPDGTRRQWKARMQGGKIVLNAANLTDQDAVWNLEHELAHETYRSPTPTLKRAWARLTKALANHPDIRAEVEALRYDPDSLTEEQAVRLAQKLDTQGPWSAAWEALKEAVWNFIKGKGWQDITTAASDRIAAALAARAIMADARGRLAPKTEAEVATFLATPQAAALSLQPSDLLPDGTPRPEVLAEIAKEKADIEAKAKADGTWMKAPNGQTTKLNEGQWLAVRTRRFKEWFGDWETLHWQQGFDTFIENSLSNPQFAGSFNYRKVTPEESAAILSMGGPDTSGMIHEVDANHLRHAIRSHADAARESAKGQRPLTRDDLPKLLQALDAPDSITVKKGGVNNTKINYTKAFPDGTIIVAERAIETSRNKSPRLTIKSAWVLSSHAGVKSNTASVYTPMGQGYGPLKKGRVNPDSVSKVVDENGEPMVVYHGTNASFESFAIDGRVLGNFRKAKMENKPFGYMEFRSGAFFSPDPEYAGHYTGENTGNIYPIFIHAANPVKKDQVTGEVSLTHRGRTPDALVMSDNGVMMEIAVIDPNQIKSATANVGTFSGDTGDIRYSLAEDSPAPASPGRAQPLDAPVLTPDGYRAISSLAIGDAITSTDGAASRVTGVYPQGRKQVYKLTLEDGRTVRATAEHLWLSRFPESPMAHVMQTQHLTDILKRGERLAIPVMAS